MSNYRNTYMNVRGDGNAVGDNNQITVVKKETHVHKHHHRAASKEGDIPIFGVAVAAIMAIAASCYYFTRHSDTIYSYLEAVAWMEALAALLATAFFSYRGAYDIAAKSGVVSIAAFAAVLLISSVASSYPRDIVNFALSTESYQGFWCGLTNYGKQLSLLHMLTAGLALAPALFCLAGPSVLLAFFGMFQIEVSDHFYTLLERLTSWGWVVTGGVLIILAGYAQSNAGWNTWANFMKSPPSWPLCQAKR